MKPRFDGRTIIVTGGARGMGANHVRAFAAEGARLVIADLLDDDGEELAKSLGADVAYRHHDVSDERSWDELVDFTKTVFGAATVLINNAGTSGGGPIETQTLAEWRRVLGVNLDGVMLGTRAVVPQMKESGRGSIVNISSFAGLLGSPMSASYTTSKFAVRGFTKAMAMELAPFNIRVNSVHPGYVRTPILGDMDDAVVVGKVALNRMARDDEITPTVLFVASDDASYSTGAEFVVDGGWSAGSPVGIWQSNTQYTAASAYL